MVDTWSGKVWHCEHGRKRCACKYCGGASICQHAKQRSKCIASGGGSICPHGRQRCNCNHCGGLQAPGSHIVHEGSRRVHGRDTLSSGPDVDGVGECAPPSSSSLPAPSQPVPTSGWVGIEGDTRAVGDVRRWEYIPQGPSHPPWAPGGGSSCRHGRERSACIKCEGTSLKRGATQPPSELGSSTTSCYDSSSRRVRACLPCDLPSPVS